MTPVSRKEEQRRSSLHFDLLAALLFASYAMQDARQHLPKKLRKEHEYALHRVTAALFKARP